MRSAHPTTGPLPTLGDVVDRLAWLPAPRAADESRVDSDGGARLELLNRWRFPGPFAEQALAVNELNGEHPGVQFRVGSEVLFGWHTVARLPPSVPLVFNRGE